MFVVISTDSVVFWSVFFLSLLLVFLTRLLNSFRLFPFICVKHLKDKFFFSINNCYYYVRCELYTWNKTMEVIERKKIGIEFMMIGWFYYKRINVKHLFRRLCVCASVCLCVCATICENIQNLSEPAVYLNILYYFLFIYFCFNLLEFIRLYGINCIYCIWTYAVSIFMIQNEDYKCQFAVGF